MYILTPQLQGICRHPGISHTLPCSSVLLRFCQMPAADCCGPRQLSRAPLSGRSGTSRHVVPVGRRDCICSINLPISLPYAMLLGTPSGMPSRQTTIKRPKESQAQAVYSLPPVFPLCAGAPSHRRCRLGCRGLHRGFRGHSGGAGPAWRLTAWQSP